MYLIVGLGNPEDKYSMTRHNMGFDVINKLAKKHDITIEKNNFQGLMGSGIINNEKIILLKPQTFMNLSGESIIECMNFYKLDLDNLIVVCDDIDLPVGTIRIRKKGSAGTHNGLKSIVHNLQNEEFTRIRIGVGNPEEKYELINHVIEKLSEEEYEELEAGINLRS